MFLHLLQQNSTALALKLGLIEMGGGGGTEGENRLIEHFLLGLGFNPVFELALFFPYEFRPKLILNLGCAVATHKG